MSSTRYRRPSRAGIWLTSALTLIWAVVAVAYALADKTALFVVWTVGAALWGVNVWQSVQNYQLKRDQLRLLDEMRGDYR